MQFIQALISQYELYYNKFVEFVRFLVNRRKFVYFTIKDASIEYEEEKIGKTKRKIGRDRAKQRNVWNHKKRNQQLI